jgi:hypothetical protein
MPKFSPGQSGNPAGRPRRTDTEKRQREAIRKALPGIVTKLIESAEAGDTTASKLLLERVMPAYKPLERPVALDVSPDLGNAGRGILAALASETIGADQAHNLAAVLALLARIQETIELEQRVKALEQAAGT